MLGVEKTDLLTKIGGFREKEAWKGTGDKEQKTGNVRS